MILTIFFRSVLPPFVFIDFIVEGSVVPYSGLTPNVAQRQERLLLSIVLLGMDPYAKCSLMYRDKNALSK